MHYREPPQRPVIRFGTGLTPVVKYFIIACVVTYILQVLWPSLTDYLGLTPRAMWENLMLYQLVTFNFLHDPRGLMHILINLLIFYMFAPELERKYGRTRFILFLAVTGIGAGLCSAMLDARSDVTIIGASGIVFGVMLVYAVLFPNRQVLFMLIFPMKVKWMMLILGAIEFWNFLGGANTGVAHVAHLGGMGFGYLFLRYDRVFFRFRDAYYRRKLKKLQRRFEVIDGGKDKDDNRKDYLH